MQQLKAKVPAGQGRDSQQPNNHHEGSFVMSTLPNHTITLTQAYAGLEDQDAVHAMIHDLPLEIDPALQRFDDVHPHFVVEALEEYTAQYRERHGHWDRWIMPDFYELVNGLDQVVGTEHSEDGPLEVCLQDSLFDATDATKRTFTDICRRELLQTGVLTWERRADIALAALAQEAELTDVSIKVHATVAGRDGQIKVCTLTTSEAAHLSIEPQGVDLDADQARTLARALLEAADELGAR